MDQFKNQLLISYGALGDYASLAPVMFWAFKKYGPLHLVGNASLLNEFATQWASCIEDIGDRKFQEWFTHPTPQFPPTSLNLFGVIKNTIGTKQPLRKSAFDCLHIPSSEQFYYLTFQDLGRSAPLPNAWASSKPKVLFHRGASSLEKRDPFLGDLVKMVQKNLGAEVRELVGPLDSPTSDFNTCTSKNFAELISTMSSCDLFIANDSAPAQWAITLGVPIVHIVGPRTHPSFSWASPHILKLEPNPWRQYHDQDCQLIEEFFQRL